MLVLTSVVSAGYYLPVIMAMYMKPARRRDAHTTVLCSRAARRRRGRRVVAILVLRRLAPARARTPRARIAAAVTRDAPDGRPRAVPAERPADERPQGRSSANTTSAASSDASSRRRSPAPWAARFASAAWERLGRAPCWPSAATTGPPARRSPRAFRQGIADAGGTAIDVGELPDAGALFRGPRRSATDGGLRSPGRTIRPSSTDSRWSSPADSMHGDDILGLYESDRRPSRWRSGAGRETRRRLRSSRATGTRSSAGTGWRGRSRSWSTAATGSGSLIAVETLRGARRRGHPALLRVRRDLPQPPSRSHRAREPARPAGARSGDTAPSSALPSTATPTGSARSTRPATIVFGDQLLVLFGRDAVRRFGPGTPVIFDVKCSEVLPQALTAGRGQCRRCGRPGTRSSRRG